MRHGAGQRAVVVGCGLGDDAEELARRGYARAPAQTPAEFATSIAEPPLREAVVRFTAAYERARFGGSPDEAAELPTLLDEIRSTLSRR